MPETSFVVCNEVETGPMLPVVDHSTLLRRSLRRPVESMWKPQRPLVECEADHALLSAMRTAFYEHLPLRLSPDTIWLTLARGFALHLNMHAEALRSRFVRHEGKTTLLLQRPDFLPGADNPWDEAFDAFSSQIEAHTGGASLLLNAEFSTTGALERAASQLMCMEAFQGYFEYVMHCGCGIPAITLTGTEEDWRSLREKASKFADFGLEPWIDALDPVLAQFERAKRGEHDTDFWRSMFRYRSGSGPAVMTGWANVLFPYIKDYRGKTFRDGDEQLMANPYLGKWRTHLEIDCAQTGVDPWNNPQGSGIGAFPACSTSVPLKVYWGMQKTDMLLVGGLLGVSQSPEDLSVSAECGWIVAYTGPVDAQDGDEQDLPYDPTTGKAIN